jgi:hypothetical protein
MEDGAAPLEPLDAVREWGRCGFSAPRRAEASKDNEHRVTGRWVRDRQDGDPSWPSDPRRCQHLCRECELEAAVSFPHLPPWLVRIWSCSDRADVTFELCFGVPHVQGLFFFNGKRVSKDPDKLLLFHRRCIFTTRPSK